MIRNRMLPLAKLPDVAEAYEAAFEVNLGGDDCCASRNDCDHVYTYSIPIGGVEPIARCKHCGRLAE